jgi:hypothetical protein
MSSTGNYTRARLEGWPREGLIDAALILEREVERLRKLLTDADMQNGVLEIENQDLRGACRALIRTADSGEWQVAVLEAQAALSE